MNRTKLLKHHHNRIKRRLALGVGQPGDEAKLNLLKKALGYATE